VRYIGSTRLHPNIAKQISLTETDHVKIELKDLRICFCIALYPAASTGSRLRSPVSLAIRRNNLRRKDGAREVSLHCDDQSKQAV